MSQDFLPHVVVRGTTHTLSRPSVSSLGKDKSSTESSFRIEHDYVLQKNANKWVVQCPFIECGQVAITL